MAPKARQRAKGARIRVASGLYCAAGYKGTIQLIIIYLYNMKYCSERADRICNIAGAVLFTFIPIALIYLSMKAGK